MKFMMMVKADADYEAGIPPSPALLAGYVGGTIVTCWRVGDPFYINIVLGLVVWLGIFLREPRLKELIPLRRHTSI